jgi:hypothetical protein
MSGSALAMMIVSIAIVWGGLVLAILNLRRPPKDPHRDL